MSDPRVLVVDDHRDMAAGIAMLLAELPLEVEIAHSARDALSLLEQREFALVLSDIRMPSMGGVELLAEVRARWPRTRVVLLTAFGSIDSAVEAMKEGASDYLTKPFDNAALIEVVKKSVAASGPAGEFDIATIVAAVAAQLSPDELLQSLGAALEELRSAAGADDCELFLSEPDGKDALLSVWVGPDGEALVERMRFGPNVGYPGIVTASGKSLSTRGELADDPRYLRPSVAERGIRAYACAPLAEPRGSLGSIHLLSRRDDFPVERAVTLLERVAVPISSAVRAGLAALRQAIDDACAPHDAGSEPQLRALLEQIGRVAHSTAGTLALVDPDSGLPAQVVSSSAATCLCARAEAGAWTECPSILSGHGFAGDRSRRSWPVTCRRGIPARVASPCCLPLAANGRFHGIVTLDLGRGGDTRSIGRLVPLLVMAQQASVHLAPRHPGLNLESGGVSTVPRDAKPPELEIRCLGPFSMTRRGVPISAEQFPRSKALSLLKVLALKAGMPLGRDYLIERLWPDADPRSGANRLHGIVHALRSVIEPQRTERAWLYVRNRGELYYLNLEAPLELDLLRYRDLWTKGMSATAGGSAGSIEALERAVALYRGDLFEDDPYAEWCEVERRALNEQQAIALERLAEILARTGERERALTHLRAALRLSPYREDLLTRVLDLLVAMGRPGEARAEYDDFRRTLHEDLGVEPSPELDQRSRKAFRPSPRPASSR